MCTQDSDTGNWTLEVAKSRLHLFLQTTRQSKDMQVRPVGPDHQRTFTAEMTVYVPTLHKTITAKEHASTKKQATNALALNLVVQLYRLGVIEAARAPGAKKASEQAVEPREVKIPEVILSDLKTLLADLNITPVPPPSGEMSEESVSVLLPLPRPDRDPVAMERGGIVDWRPPHIDWDPWCFRSAYQSSGLYSQLEPEERAKRLSHDLKDEYLTRKQNDLILQKRLEERYSLPIASISDHIVSAIGSNQVVIIRGNTGCGKTTQVPQYILDSFLESGQGASCNIIVTQPRRISAISVSERIAAERGEELGHTCGYSVRFESVLPRHYASVLFCTVGVLLRKLEAGLVGISHVIVDEIHERDLNSDFLLVVLRDMLGMYPELRVVLMSATIDTSLFSRYFNNCPVIEVVGKTFPVDEYFLEDAIELVHFIPLPSKKKKKELEDEDEDENLNMVCDTHRYSLTTQHAMFQLNEKEIPFELIEALLHHFKTMNTPGAVLVFLPGWNSIFSLHRHLANHPVFGSGQYWLLPCHSQVPRDEQRKAFATTPNGITKIIMATNIAETSITINDVVFVIDSARAKVKMFTSHNSMTNYATVWASKTNLEQRCGRAGRVRPGYCFHLCSRARYERLAQYLTPEILRTPLDELGLTIKLLGLGDIGTFLSKAMEPPPPERVTEAVVLLHEMEALDVNERLTPLGIILARLPIEPRVGKMIVLGCVCGVGDAICTIAACTCFPEPFLTQPGHKRLGFIHKKFVGHRASDHLAMMVAFYQWERVSEDEQAERSFCEVNLLAQSSMHMAAEARVQ